MNSETQLLIKMTYAESVCNVLLHHAKSIEAIATLNWMRNRTVTIVRDILAEGTKQTRSWASVAERCRYKWMELLDDGEANPDDVDMDEEILYNLALLTRMLEDITFQATKIANRYEIEAMVIETYTLERIMGLTGKYADIREDEVREHAFEFLNKLYSKMDET